MSLYRDSLPAAQRAALDAALELAGPVARQMQEEVARKATVEGPRAVAEAGHAVRAGLKTADQVERDYRQHLDEERERARAA